MHTISGREVKGVKRYTPRLFEGGNYCGHSPHSPAFIDYSKKVSDGTHPILKKAIELLGGYYRKPKLLEKLGCIRTNGDERAVCGSGRYRAVRSEQRDINIKVMAHCLSKLNLFKLQVGIVPYSNFDDLYSPTEQQIATELGENLIRVQRAFAHWKHAGYISITPRRRLNDTGKWESIAPIICVRKTLLVLIGISEKWLTTAQQYIYDKWKREREKRFERAAMRQQSIAQAKAKENHDFFTQDLLRKVGEMKHNQRSWRDRTHPPNGPPSATEAPGDD